jgi:hypothetical protein
MVQLPEEKSGIRQSPQTEDEKLSAVKTAHKHQRRSVIFASYHPDRQTAII